MPFEPVVRVSEAVPLLMNVPSDVDGAVKVTEAPPNGEPFEVTKTENVPNGLPSGCGVTYPPDCAAIAMVGGGGGGVVFELPLLLQPVRNPKTRQTKINAGMLVKLRFIASTLSRWRVHGLVATLQSHAHCA